MSRTPKSVPRRTVVCRAFDGIPDWYRVEWAEHDGRTWFEQSDHGEMCWCMSARIEPFTCVEGSACEMCGLARAILEGGTDDYKRCAVRVVGDVAKFWSPRNSNERMGLVHIEDAREMARWILANLHRTDPPQRQGPERTQQAGAASGERGAAGGEGGVK